MKSRHALLALTLACAALTAHAGSFFDAELKDLSGKPQKLSSLKGKPVVVNYWATWCSPCREEIPEFVTLARQYAGKVRFIGIAIDDAPAVSAFAKQYKMNYPTLLGEADAMALMKQEGNTVGGLPYTAIYDSQGKRVATHTGRISAAQLEATLKTLR
ncbi:TlpA family protein disulfide reductase [Jeongeupia naejangsanensis]|uniref:TlpA family protein disulfide reductase n=1 Tax=Jeongeupia naejangsanensis TaxID=613195 RepID=A0ABS2BM24_9NEIS|nr:TlpA disulfide reductase family protein [Jeongeupia naejangsanensis]MBM3116664.1 TlpA family protein disulfide reductase [Jeongeupia naejangsanensis]